MSQPKPGLQSKMLQNNIFHTIVYPGGWRLHGCGQLKASKCRWESEQYQLGFYSTLHSLQSFPLKDEGSALMQLTVPPESEQSAVLRLPQHCFPCSWRGPWANENLSKTLSSRPACWSPLCLGEVAKGQQFKNFLISLAKKQWEPLKHNVGYKRHPQKYPMLLLW